MDYQVVLFLDLFHDLIRCSKIFTGLELLVRQGRVDLRIQPGSMPPHCQVLNVYSRKQNRSLRLFFDLNDHSDRIYQDALDSHDVYFKRSFYPPDLERFSSRQRARILSFGLNYSCTIGGSTRRILKNWSWQFLQKSMPHPRFAWKHGRQLFSNVRGYLNLPYYQALEQSQAAVIEPKVLFQTRVWEQHETTEDAETINEQRVGLVRRLRREFGPRFQGGVVPTPFARKQYPDVAVKMAYRRKDYLKLTQRHLIGVYSRGLFQSLAFKLPEYLAASLCVVSEPLRNQLPHPLEPGKHFLEFRSEEQCLAQCERLLRSPREAETMRRHNHDYYKQWLSPREHVLDCLDRAFAA